MKKRAAISTTTIIAIDGLNLAYWYGSGLAWAAAHLIISPGHIKRTPIRVQIGRLGSELKSMVFWFVSLVNVMCGRVLNCEREKGLYMKER